MGPLSSVGCLRALFDLSFSHSLSEFQVSLVTLVYVCTLELDVWPLFKSRSGEQTDKRTCASVCIMYKYIVRVSMYYVQV